MTLQPGLVAGTVSRIDPAVIAGMVKVDVLFSEPLPKGARPDLSIDGSVQIAAGTNRCRQYSITHYPCGFS